jgi:hypothetical protein
LRCVIIPHYRRLYSPRAALPQGRLGRHPLRRHRRARNRALLAWLPPELDAGGPVDGEDGGGWAFFIPSLPWSFCIGAAGKAQPAAHPTPVRVEPASPCLDPASPSSLGVSSSPPAVPAPSHPPPLHLRPALSLGSRLAAHPAPVRHKSSFPTPRSGVSTLPGVSSSSLTAAMAPTPRLRPRYHGGAARRCIQCR